MAIPKQITELLQQKPGLSSVQIAQEINAKLDTVKVTLHNMVKKEKLVREKIARVEKTKSGPQNLYAYKLSEVKSDNAITQNG